MTRRLCSTFAMIFFLNGCALMGGGAEDPVVKNSGVKFNSPDSPFEKFNVSSADSVWQSKTTGNTIALNSMCQKYEDVSLKALQQNILAGIDNLKINSEVQTTFDGREATRVLAEGATDGVPIRIDIMIFKKNGCTYDIAYIARKKYFEQEEKIFNRFLSGVHAP